MVRPATGHPPAAAQPPEDALVVTAEPAPPLAERLLRPLLGLIVPALIVVVWEALARVGLIDATLVPPPSAVLATITDLASAGELAHHVWATLLRVLQGFLWGVAAATVLGALTGYSATLRALLDPTVQAIRNVPSIAWVPLFILWFGIFETSKVILIAVGVFFPVYLGLLTGVQGVDRKLVEVGRMHRFSGLQMIGRILVPAALPSYVTGLRSGLGLGWMFVVAAELMGASEGLGFLLVDGQQTFKPAQIVAAIVLFAILGKLTDMLLGAGTSRLLAWQDTVDTRR
ncbi:MAG: ABC transporter permease [Geminicoccaceae bacterium]